MFTRFSYAERVDWNVFFLSSRCRPEMLTISGTDSRLNDYLIQRLGRIPFEEILPPRRLFRSEKFLGKIEAWNLSKPNDWKRSLVKLICGPEKQKSCGRRRLKTENPTQRAATGQGKPENNEFFSCMKKLQYHTAAFLLCFLVAAQHLDVRGAVHFCKSFYNIIDRPAVFQDLDGQGHVGNTADRDRLMQEPGEYAGTIFQSG